MAGEKVLLFGDTGMLGQKIRETLELDGYRVFGVSRSSKDCQIDIRDDKAVQCCFRKVRPDIVINSAAIVSIDGCEENPSEAYLVNGRFPGVLSRLCKREGAYFIQISTDHFFTGDFAAKHSEECNVTIVNEYARSKYIGECLSLTYSNSLVLRTNVVGFRGRGQDTFIEWIIRSVNNHERMTLYNDFYTSSINSIDFSRILADIIPKRAKGLLNLASSEVANKKNFIIELVKAIYGHEPSYIEESVHDISNTERADSIGLDTKRVENLVGYRMPNFKETITSIAEDYRRRYNNAI